MDSKEEVTADGHRHAAATDNSGGSNNTMALQRKRARRVSFAEMTSVHFFDRDEEDHETPLAKSAKLDGISSNELIFGLELEQSKEVEGEDNDVEEIEMPRSFLRPLGSPSPGGSTLGSASSNDEDNFFGPVSANFIRPGRLSGSAASEDIHDVTMDSTAFSMHYRSLSRSESGGDLKTPTIGQLLFEDKTPIDTSVGSSMILTSAKKLSPKSSSPVSKLSGSHNSNDMSLVVANVNRYDYEKLSPGLDALLAESKKNLLSISAADDVTTSKLPKIVKDESFSSLDHGDSLVKARNGASKEQVTYSQAEGFLEASSNGFSPKNLSACTFDATTCCISDYKPNPSPHQLSKPQDENKSPLILSPSPVQQQMHLIAACPCKDLEMVSPSQEKPNSVLRLESIGHQDVETPIRRSISKLELIEKSSFSSAFSARVDNSTIKSLEFMNSPLDSLLHKDRKTFKSNLVKDIVTHKKLAIGSESGEPKKSSVLDIDEEHMGGIHNLEERLDHITCWKSPNNLSARNISSVLKRGAVSSSIKNSMLGLSTENSSEDILMTKTESLLAEIASRIEDRAIMTPNELVSSRETMLDKKLSASPGHQWSKFKELMFQDQFKPFTDFDKDHNKALDENLVDSHLSTDVALGMEASLNFPTSEVNHVKQSIEFETGSRKVDIDSKENLGTIGNFTNSVKDKNSRLMQPNALDKGIKSTNTSKFTNNLVGDEFRAISDNGFTPLENLNKLSLRKRNVTCQSGQSGDLRTMEHPNGGSAETKIGQGKCWTDIFSKFLENIEQLIPRSDNEFNNKMFDVLENLLLQLQKSKFYEMLHADAVPKRTYVFHDLQIERVAETNIMLSQIALEKAKLQMNHLKRDILLKRLQLLSSRIQESQSIRKDLFPGPLEISAGDVLVHSASNQSVSVCLNGENEVCHEKLAAMRSALEASERKISNFYRNFRASYKIGTEPGCSDTIALVNEHLMKRAYCRFIRLDMQMWMVHSVDSRNCRHNIVFDYLGFVAQSVKVIVGPVSSTSFSFETDDTNMMKNFPNVDACTAVAFVLNSGTNHKYAGFKMLVREMQVTSSLFGNLLDVFEEVQLAQIEFQNLTESSFLSPSAEDLVLKLCFYNFIAGRKVILKLDMSCLKRGIYPSEILPFQIGLHPDVRKCSLWEPILDTIKDELKSLKTGYMRIFELCRCVSQVIQAASSASN